MKVAEFERAKVKSAIKRIGETFEFKRFELDEMNEKTGEFVKDKNDKEIVMNMQGIYHEGTSYVQRTTSESSVTRTKKQPMILCLMSDIVNAGIRVNDVMIKNGLQYEVINISDIQNLNVIADISLEVLDNGK